MRFIYPVRGMIAMAVIAALLLPGCKPEPTPAPPPAVVAAPQNNPVPVPPTPPATPPPGLPPAAIINYPQERLKVEHDLNEIGTAYNEIWSANPNGPSRLEDLYANLGGPQSPMSQGLANGKYKVYLNVNAFSVQEKSNTVLAYYWGVPSSGGPVLMADGSVTKYMDAATFNATPKAGK